VWPLAKEPTEELGLAEMLIEAAGGKVDWTVYLDQAAQELKSLIEAKLAGKAVAEATAPPRILSLLEALQQSVGAQNGNAVAPRVEEKTPAPAPVKARTNRKRIRRTP
jgi:non-homologous end joining protein Ku